ncbi:F-box protein CPR1-like [Impatiens glandulifera]|uniref:F-box protein CPR1-like n=1 Tax=Impatiens glandulifera TaxID=253017 RepID=UPI001FB1909C|nr:F-box protein CPR1-like [Impatiens glandulifera]
MSLIPDEILPDILCRLPVKCLLRLRCVSKFWLALISSSHFVKLHLSRSVQTKNNLRIFMWKDNIYRVDFDPLNEGFLPPVAVDYLPLSCLVMSLIMEMRFADYDGGILLCGSCDGLLCLSNTISINTVLLWNPSTGKSIKLPYPSVDLRDKYEIIYNCTYQFGYDNTNDDYKVVRMVLYSNILRVGSHDYELNVYSLKSNLWHKSEAFPHCLRSELRRFNIQLVMREIASMAIERHRLRRLKVRFEKDGCSGVLKKIDEETDQIIDRVQGQSSRERESSEHLAMGQSSANNSLTSTSESFTKFEWQ